MMSELRWRQALPIVLLAGLGAVPLLSLTASKPLKADEQQRVDTASETLAVQVGGVVEGPLRPGVTRPLDLTVRNPTVRDVVITSITVSVVAVTGREAPRSCPLTDFTVSPGRMGPLAVGAGEVLQLSDSEVPRAVWPTVRMLNLPINQDGCKGAVLTLDYQASGEVR